MIAGIVNFGIPLRRYLLLREPRRRVEDITSPRAPLRFYIPRREFLRRVSEDLCIDSFEGKNYETLKRKDVGNDERANSEAASA